ncbi:hypothetical protein ACYAFX_10875 [Rhodococcus aetherivorans]
MLERLPGDIAGAALGAQGRRDDRAADRVVAGLETATPQVGESLQCAGVSEESSTRAIPSPRWSAALRVASSTSCAFPPGKWW